MAVAVGVVLKVRRVRGTSVPAEGLGVSPRFKNPPLRVGALLQKCLLFQKSAGCSKSRVLTCARFLFERQAPCPKIAPFLTLLP